MARTQAWWALAASLGLHAVPLTRAFGRVRVAEKPIPAETQALDAPAILSGETFDIDATASPSAPVQSASSPALETAPSERPLAAPARAASAPAASAAGSTQLRAPPLTASTSGSYGEDRTAALAASLGKGLLRVLPRVAYPESSFHELSYGSRIKTRFSVELDGDGHALPPRFDEHRVSEPWFDALVVRALLLLRAGTFALQASTPGELGHGFELEALVGQGTPASGDWLEPRDLAEIGRLVEPTERQPGRAHFIYNSGREVRLTLRLVPRP